MKDEARRAMREISHVVTAEEAGSAVRAIVRRVMGVSRGMYASLKFADAVTINGGRALADRTVAEGDVLAVRYADARETALAPYALPLRVAYRDEDLLVIDKPAPLPSVRSAHQTDRTLENALYSYDGEPEDFVYRPINRLDKGTSGLMLVARNAYIQNLMQRMLHTDRFARQYLAVTEGAPRDGEGVIDLPIALETPGRARRVVRADGKRSVTRYRVIREENGRALVSLLLETGRTHQIRVHMAALGCPVVGDYLYGRSDESLGGRFALHAARVTFDHPVLKKTISLESPLPDELRALLTAGRLR